MHLSLVARSSQIVHIREDVCNAACARNTRSGASDLGVCASFGLLLLWFFGLRTVYLRGLSYVLVSGIAKDNKLSRVSRLPHRSAHANSMKSQEKLCEIVQFLIIIKYYRYMDDL